MAFQFDAVKSQRVDLQQSNIAQVGAGAGDDVYVIDAQNFPLGNKVVTINDGLADGNNKLVLVGGLEIVSSKVFANALELTLNNGVVVQVLGASTFLFQTGGAVFTGVGGVTQSFSDFVTQSLGTTVPAAGAPATTGSAVTVNSTGGGTTPGGGIVDVPTLTLAQARAAEELPAEYNINTTAVVNAGAVSVADAEAAYDAVTVIIDGAANAADLELADLFVWSLADTLENLEAAPEGVLAGAASYTLSVTTFTLDAVEGLAVADLAAAVEAAAATVTGNEVLQGAANAADVVVNVPYTLADTLANLQAADAAVLAGATTYSLSDAAGDLGKLTQEQAALVTDATNGADYTFELQSDVFSLTASAESVDEGASITFSVEKGQPDFTYNYELTGVDAADVQGGALTGTVTTDANGKGTITVALANDRVTDGVDTLKVTLPNTGLSASVTVNDTSLVNVAPVAVAATGATTEAGAVVTGQLVATDAENDALTFTLAAPVEGLTLNAEGTYSFDPSLNSAAQALTSSAAALPIVANYTVTDAEGATTTSTLTITVTPKPLTFEIKADKTSAPEGATTVYTVTASEALATPVDVIFTLEPGNGVAVNTGTATTNTADFATGSFNPKTVTIAAGQTTATFDVVAVNDAVTELQESYSVKAEIAGQAAPLTLSGKVVDATSAGGVGQTFMLTTAVDTMPGLIGSAASTGTDGNDTINATGTTLTALDNLNGGLGNDTLKLIDADGTLNKAMPNGIKLTSVESMEVQTAGSLGIAAVTGQAARVAVKAVDTYTIPSATLSKITATYGGTATNGDTLVVDADGLGTNPATTLTYVGISKWAIAGTEYASLQLAVAAAVNTQSTGTAAAFVGSDNVVYTKADLSAWTFTAGTNTGTVAATKAIDDDALVGGGKFSIKYNGVTLQTAAVDADPTKAEAQALIAGVINGIAGSTVATVAGDNLVITAPVAGVDLPGDIAITYWANGTGTTANPDAIAGAVTPTSSVANQTAQDAVTPVTAAPYDVSGFADLVDVAVTASKGMALKAAATQNVTVSGATDTVSVVGGKDVTITDVTTAKAITVSNSAATGNAAGAITITDTKQGNAVIVVDGGTTVAVTATTDKASSGNITIGANKAASGAVVVTQNTTNDADAEITAGNIAVTGGSTVTVNVNATNTATAAGKNDGITIGDIVVLGDSKTTDVTVTQNASTTVFTTPVVAETGATQTVTFKALTAGQTTALTHGEKTLTFTAAKALDANQVAQAFADLVNLDRQDNGGPTANGTYSGQFAAAWASTSVNGAVVTFTAKNDDTAPLTAGGTVLPTLGTLVAGVNGSGGVATNDNTVTLGDVSVNDNATEAIKTITLNGFDDATLGSAGSLDALTTLNLANSKDDTTLYSTSKTLAVKLNNIGSTGYSDVALGGNVETLTLTTEAVASKIDLVAAGVKTLTIDAGVTLELTEGGGFDNVLETVTIKGAGAVDLDDISAAGVGAGKLKSFSAADNTGGVTASVSAKTADVAATFTKYVFSQGADNVTLVDAVVNKAIELGAGNDTITLAALTTSLAANIDGGTGSNTLVMDSADADTASDATTFEAKIAGFDKLSLNIVGDDAQDAIDLANLDDIKYVISAGTVDGAQVKTLTLTEDTAIVANNTVSITINGKTYTTAALAGTVGATEIATAIDTAVDDYNVAAVGSVLTFTSATGAATVVSGLTVNLGGAITKGAVSGVEAVTSSQLTLDNMLDGGTLELTDAGTGAVVNMKDASATADVLNVVTGNQEGAAVNVGTVVANGVETFNVTTTDTFIDVADGVADGEDDANSAVTLGLQSDKVTKVTVTGAGDIELVATNATLEEVDASTLSGILDFTASVNDLVVKGGTAADDLTANANDVKLYGNGGGDTLTVAGGLRVNLYGGDGADTFVFNVSASATLDAYTVINVVTSGDTIKLGDATKFSTTKIALSVGADETLLNYANQATKNLAENEMGWFQRDGKTFIVLDQGGAAADAFDAGTDQIIMITGLVDLGTASYNSTINTLEIA